MSDHVRALRRRKWVIVLAVVVSCAVAVLFSLRQQKLYQASAEVLINQQNVTASLTGIPDPFQYYPERFVATQVDLARLPAVAQRVTEETGIETDLLSQSTVSSRDDSNILEFTVTHPLASYAATLATAYARQFTIYRRELDTAAIARARQEVAAEIRALTEAGDHESPLRSSLAEKEQELRTMEALQTSNASLVRTAEDAAQVQPKPVRNAVLALMLGLVGGIALAFLWEALDTRVRTADEIGERLGLPLLARLPGPPRALRRTDRLAMLAEPHSPNAEAFRMLRTNLEFANLEHDARTIMVTSAVTEEGKSTTVANLAVALARAGRRVVLVDVDLRRPSLDRFFDGYGRHGLTDVALGHVDIDDALTRVPIDDASNGPAQRQATNGDGRVTGVLQVLTSGPVPPDAGEFVNTKALGSVFMQLRERADVVLVDAPPLLQVGDAMALSSKVDALILVTRLNIIRRTMLTELRRLLDASPAAKLGFVVTGTDAGEPDYGAYFGYYAPYKRAERERVG